MALITLRNGLGRLLTSQEGDDNLTNLNNELALAQARYYGDVDPTTIPGVNVVPGFFWAHESAGQMKVRNTTNDGWYDLYELFSKIYTRASVVGTVSEEAGVPAGSIIQYGSNPQGDFWRLAGGLQICLGFLTTNVTTVPSGQIHISSSTLSGAWPAGFNPSYTIRSIASTVTGSNFWATQVGTGHAGFVLRLQSGSNFSDTPVTFWVIGIGRW